MREYSIHFDDIPEAEAMARGYVKRALTNRWGIEHNGCRFATDVFHTKSDVRVWPIEELLARKAYRPEQAQRIRKLNPYGKPDGEACVLFEARA